MPPIKKTGVKRAKATKYYKRKRNADQTLPVDDTLNVAPEGEITPTEPPKKKGRGPAAIRPVKDNPEERPEIWVVGQHEFSCAENPRLITATITRTALKLMPGPLRSFHGFDKFSKLALERDFLVTFILVCRFIF